MKEVRITICGDLFAMDYCSTSFYDGISGFIDNFTTVCGWEKIDSLTVDIDNDTENLVKKKGKYINTNEFFHEKMGPGTKDPFPVEIHTKTYRDTEIEYYVKLEDDEEFDIKKVQLLKSCEFPTHVMPYFIVANYILYNGEEIYSDDIYNFCPEEKCYNEGMLTEFADRDY